MALTEGHRKIIDIFLQEQNIVDLYKSYHWNDDNWQNGFPEIFQLEKEISKAARNNSLGRDHLKMIADWGRLRNKKRISWREPRSIQFYVNNSPAEWLEKEPEKVIQMLDDQIVGFGPTYCSKILHFAVPVIFGALDSRLVRTFGKGAKRYPLLNLKATRSKTGGSITKQARWPGEFNTWISVLNYFARTLNEQGKQCPHPPNYLQTGLRVKGVWLPADVETALFSYTYKEA